MSVFMDYSSKSCKAMYLMEDWSNFGKPATEEECQTLCCNSPTCQYVEYRKHSDSQDIVGCTAFTACDATKFIDDKDIIIWKKEASSGAADTTGTILQVAASDLNHSINETAALRKTVARVLYKSQEEAKSIKSLLTTSSTGIKAMNDLLMEMVSLDHRMALFSGNMDSCRAEVKALEESRTQILSPDEVNDPVLGATTSLMQLGMHATTLRQQIRSIARFQSGEGLPEILMSKPGDDLDQIKSLAQL